MGPVRQNPIQRPVRSVHICVCIALCTIVAHNTVQNRPDSFPPYPPDNHLQDNSRSDNQQTLAATLRGSRPGVQSASLIMTSLITS